METKKTRSPNYSPREKAILVDIILTKYTLTIENSKTNAVSNREKEACWILIEEEYNSQVTIKRTWKSLKKTYEGIKMKAKKDVASDKVRIYKTGGGEDEGEGLDTTGKKVLSIIGPKITPMSNPFDSDASYNSEIVTGDITIEELTEEEKKESKSPSIGKSNQLMICEAGNGTPKIQTSKNWKDCWNDRRRPDRPKQKVNLMEKKVSAVAAVGDLAISKKKYYDRLLTLAEEEHHLKLQVLNAKVEHYAKK